MKSSHGKNSVLRIRIRCFSEPWIREGKGRKGKENGSGMNIPDNFYESLETVFRAKPLNILKFLNSGIVLSMEPGYGMENSDPVCLTRICNIAKMY
jgi:hypothetical protein